MTGVGHTAEEAPAGRCGRSGVSSRGTEWGGSLSCRGRGCKASHAGGGEVHAGRAKTRCRCAGVPSTAGPGLSASLSSSAHSSPVQAEVCEPVLDHDHHVADREEEGRNLERLREQGGVELRGDRRTGLGGWWVLAPSLPPTLAQLPHLHLHIGVWQGVLWRQLAVVVDEVVQDGGAQDGLQWQRRSASSRAPLPTCWAVQASTQANTVGACWE